MTGFYPEMGEKADTTKLFQAQHVIGSTYGLNWNIATTAGRAAFRTFKLRPRIELVTAENTYSWQSYFAATCTSAAYRKMRDATLTCLEMLLD